MVSKLCNHKNKCCKVTYIPLVLAWGATIHSFQGLQAGPTKENQQDNTISRICVDPGTLEFEKRCPGTLYSACSRPTTIGSIRNCNDSALYFFGSNMCKQCVPELCVNKNGRRSLQLQKRDVWVNYLNHRVKQWKIQNMSMFDHKIVQNTMKNIATYKTLSLEDIIQHYIQRLQTQNDSAIQPLPAPHKKWIEENPYNNKKQALKTLKT